MLIPDAGFLGLIPGLGDGLGTLWIMLMGFVVLIFPLNAMMFQPIFRALDERAERIQGARDRSTQLQSEADAVLDRYETAIREARSESESQRQGQLATAREEQAALTTQARSDAEQGSSARAGNSTDPSKKRARPSAVAPRISPLRRLNRSSVDRCPDQRTPSDFERAKSAMNLMPNKNRWSGLYSSRRPDTFSGCRSGCRRAMRTMTRSWRRSTRVSISIVLGLFYFGRGPITEYFKTRRRDPDRSLRSGRAATAAEQRNAELRRRLVDLTSEIEEIREGASRRADEEAERILAEARATADRIRSDARAAVDQELRRAQAELREEAADLALEIAAKKLTDTVSESDRERLMDEFITRVEPGNAAEGAN